DAAVDMDQATVNPSDGLGFARSYVVAQIQNVGGVVAGAGFLVGPGVLVTCAHVVVAAGGRPGERLRVVFPHLTGAPAMVGVVLAEAGRAPAADDVAVLRLAHVPEDVAALALGSAAGCRGHRVSSFGFPAQAPPGGHFGYGVAGDLLPGADGGLLL